MHSGNFVRILLATILAGWSLLVLAQGPDEEESARGAFLITRKKAPGPPRQQSGDKKKPETGARPGSPPPAVGGADVKSEDPIGLGYTLYKLIPEGKNDKAVRVKSSQVFYEGDAVRLVIEPNTDGHLYVFHTENDGAPQMIFPDARLNQGANHIEAHVPYEVPPRKAPFQLEFDKTAATEHLYLVLTRKPLTDVPTREKLVAYCQPNPEDCQWRPAGPVWSQIVANASAPKRVSHQKEMEKQAQTQGEREAITRGLKLKPTAPEPSVVLMNVSSSAEMLVTMVDLIHK